MYDLAQSVLTWVQRNQEWGAPLVFALSFCESFAFVSLVVPATSILIGIGALVATIGLNFWPVWNAAVLGGVAGDWIAYSIAWRYKDRILQLWPFSTHERLVVRGGDLCTRWGMLAVFCGRFFGPLRAIVPIAAGLYAMPWLKFQASNLASAFAWATAILTPGFLGIRWLVS